MGKLDLFIAGSFLMMSLLACQKDSSFQNISIIGHAGNGLDNFATFYQDNSLESIEMALKTTGCDGIEVDVQISNDGTLWLYHDEKLNSETNGESCIPLKSDKQLAGLNYSSVHKEKVIQLTEIPIDLLSGRRLYLDLRHFNVCNNTIVDLDKMVEELVEYKNQNSSIDLITVTSYIPLIEKLENESFEVFIGVNSIEKYQSMKSKLTQMSGVVARYKDFSKDDVSLIQSDNCKVVLFDMRSVSGIRKALKKLPDAIITDNLKSAIIEVE